MMRYKITLLFFALILSFKVGFSCEVQEEYVGFPSSTTASSLDREESLEKSLKRKRKEENPDFSTHKKKKEKKEEHITSSPSLKAIEQPSISRKPDAFYTKFCEIIKKGPYPIQPIQCITVQDEEKEGSRKWVSFFGSNGSEIHEWHRKQSNIVQAIQKINATHTFLPAETNFALARLTFVLKSNQTKVKELPFFFVSGWPANNNKEPISKFAKKLSEGKLDDQLKDYTRYGLRFITLSYKGEESPKSLRDRRYDSFRDELKKVMETKLEDKDKLISETRLKTHVNILSDQQNSIFAKLYFHSEQSIWILAKEEAEKFKKELLRTDLLQYVVLDICSYYDMCWCCGDTLGSCSHALQSTDKSTKIVIRASGCKAYFETPFASQRYSLREHRKEFPGFKEGKSYEMEPYKPHIAHATMEDFSE